VIKRKVEEAKRLQSEIESYLVICKNEKVVQEVREDLIFMQRTIANPSITFLSELLKRLKS
jgi:hypothetical protein